MNGYHGALNRTGKRAATMTDFSAEHDDGQDEEEKSKSQIKREMHAFQELGRQMLELKPAQLAKLDLTAEMRAALEEAHRHTARGALKRHMNFVGKLMRDQDIETIKTFLDRLDSSSQVHAQFFHELERWRDRLLTGDANQQQAFMEAYPEADRQTVRQLVRQAAKETAENKPPAASRKLFKLIREAAENAD